LPGYFLVADSSSSESKRALGSIENVEGEARNRIRAAFSLGIMRSAVWTEASMSAGSRCVCTSTNGDAAGVASEAAACRGWRAHPSRVHARTADKLTTVKRKARPFAPACFPPTNRSSACGRMYGAPRGSESRLLILANFARFMFGLQGSDN